MSSLAPFLPPFLVDDLAGQGQPAELPFARDEAMALLLSDITGYTALTERLQSRGREGAEEVASVLNRVFRPAIEAIEAAGGSVTCFGGDALFTLFRGSSATRRARATSERIRDQFRARGAIPTSAGPVELRIKQALHHGTVTLVHLGRGERRCYLATGEAVAELARLESKATGEEIVISSAMSQRLRTGEKRARLSPAAGDPGLLATYLDPRLRPFLERPGMFRPVTVMFLETAGGRLAELQRFFYQLGRVLDDHDGVLVGTDISQRGTRWLCAFGLPAAHEHDAARAGRAALVLREALGGAPRLRAAIHRGIVAMLVVGAPTRRALSTLGDVVNTAARTLERARWGEVLATEEARPGLYGIATVARGTHRMKGKSGPIVLHALGAREVARGRELRVSAPLVGRERELLAIEDALEAVADGHGLALALHGEAGIGKSRLKWEASRLARAGGFLVFEGGCVSFAQEPLHAIADLLRGMLDGSTTGDRVRALGLPADEALWLDHIMGHPLGEAEAGRLFAGQDAEAIRAARDAALAALLRTMATDRPILVVLEDLHWADESTKETVAKLAAALSRDRCLLLLLHRDGYDPPPEARRLELPPLDRGHMRRLVLAVLGTTASDVVDTLVARAEGNPLFAEEMARHILERGIAFDGGGSLGTRELRPTDLPQSVETLIAARLDRLSPAAARAAELGATFGRSFPEGLLEHVDGEAGSGASAAAAVGELLSAEILLVERESPRRQLVFKHALTREAAYARVLVSERRRLHRRVAGHLAALAPAERATSLHLLAYHWEHASEPARAAKAYLEAASHLYARYASEDAIDLYQRGIRLLPPRSPEAIRASSDMAAGPMARLGRTVEAIDIAQAADAAARTLRDMRLVARTSYALGYLCSNSGRPEVAKASLERAVASARRIGDGATEARACIYVANLHAGQGRPAEAHRWAERAAEVGTRNRDGYATSRSRFIMAQLADGRGDAEASLALYGEALIAARAQGDEAFAGLLQNNRAALLLAHGRLDEARALLEQELRRHAKYRIPTLLSYAIFNLGVIHLRSGEEEQGLAHLGDALARSVEAHDRRLECVAREALALARLERGEIAPALHHVARGAKVGRALADPRIAAAFDTAGARLERIAFGRMARAAALIARAETKLRGLREWQGKVQSVCERGHLALARGHTAGDHLAAARALLPSQNGIPIRSQEVERLARAIAAQEAGEALLRGERAVDIRPALRAVLERGAAHS